MSQCRVFWCLRLLPKICFPGSGKTLDGPDISRSPKAHTESYCP